MKVEDEAASAAHKTAATKIMGFAHCVLLVLSIDLGGLASSLWQTFLLCGLKAAMIMFLVMSLGSFVLLLCLSELVGIVPFAGGNFGFVRCALGPFWGFLAAAMELLYYNMYNARNLLKVAMLVQAAHALPPTLQPLWAFLGAVVVLLVNLRGGLSFWGPMMAAALFTVAVLLLFYAGAYSHLDLNGYGYGHRYDAQYHNDGFLGDGRRYVSQSFRVTLFYLGLDTLPLCSLRVRDEARVIPRALMTSFGVIFAIAVLATLGVALSRPGIHPTLASAEYVLQFGLADAVSMDPKRYPLLLLPPTIASCIGYLYASGNQLAAMAESGLMPKALRPRLGADAVPAVALVVCAGLQFLVYLVLHLAAPGDVTFPFNVWSLAAPGLFALICAAFVAFRYKFASMQRTFVSPLGVPGAVFGVALWAHIFVVSSDYHFQTDTKAIAAFYGFMAAMVAYYVGFAQFVQFFSPEEQQKFMKAYVLNANQLRRRRGGYHGYMANMWRRTAAVSALFGFGTSRRTIDRSTDAANANATAAASKASTAAPPQPLLSHNKVSVEPFASASARLSARPPDRKASLRASLTNGSVAVGWSGRALLAEPDSRRVFHLLNPAAAPVEQAAGDEEGTVAAEEEAGAAPGVALLEEFPEHFEPLLTADGAAEDAASAAELAAMVADGGCAFDEALRSAEEV